MGRLSICIGTRNRADKLARHLAHIAEFKTLDFEVVVSDNCSQDHTEEVVAGFKDRIAHLYYIRQPKPLTFYETIIAPCNVAVGDYLMFIADDDLLIEDGLLEAVVTLDQHDNITAVYGGWQQVDGATGAVMDVKQRWDEGLVIPAGALTTAVTTMAVIELPIFRRSAFHKSHTAIQHQYPFDLNGMSLFMRHGDIYLMPTPVASVHTHDGQESRHLYRDDITHCYIADFELGISQCLSLSDEECRKNVTDKICYHYVISARRALENQKYLQARTMLMRAIAYRYKPALEMIVPLMEQYAMHMIAENLINLTETALPVDKLLVEQTETCESIADLITELRPDIAIERASATRLVDYEFSDREILLYGNAELLPSIEHRLGRRLRKARHDRDLIAACQIFKQ